MKTLFPLAFAMLLFTIAFSQSPEKISYQSIVRDTSGKVVVNQLVAMKISVIKKTINGTAVYVETHRPKANANGLVTLQIGDGDVVFGDFSTINWGDGPFYLKTQIDPSGDSTKTSYTVSGTTQLLSVPYALYANSASLRVSEIGDTLYSGKNYVLIPGISKANEGNGDSTIPFKTFIPDDKFEAELIRLGLDDVIDDSVLTSSIDTVQTLSLGWKQIQSVEGIANFKNLQVLTLTSNKLNQIDVSKNLKLQELYLNNTLIPTSNFNTISSIDVSKNKELRILDLYDLSISEINLTNNTKLEKLYIGNNHSFDGNNLTTIDLKNNINLNYLQMGQMNLDSIDLSTNVLIEELILVSMPLNNIDVTNLQNLQKLNIGGTSIKTIDLSQNDSLKQLFALFNNNVYLDSLDISQNVNLELLNIRGTGLRNVNLNNNKKLTSISLESTSIDISNTGIFNIKTLNSFNIRNQQSGELDFSNFPSLTMVSLYSTGITNLDFSKNTSLTYLFLDNLPISNLDISDLNNLQSFCATNMMNLQCIKASDAQILSQSSNPGNWAKDNNVLMQTICN